VTLSGARAKGLHLVIWQGAADRTVAKVMLD
jgi:hypothetical protein